MESKQKSKAHQQRRYALCGREYRIAAINMKAAKPDSVSPLSKGGYSVEREYRFRISTHSFKEGNLPD